MTEIIEKGNSKTGSIVMLQHQSVNAVCSVTKKKINRKKDDLFLALALVW